MVNNQVKHLATVTFGNHPRMQQGNHDVVSVKESKVIDLRPIDQSQQQDTDKQKSPVGFDGSGQGGQQDRRADVKNHRHNLKTVSDRVISQQEFKIGQHGEV